MLLLAFQDPLQDLPRGVVLREAIAFFEKAQDYTSREILERILEGEEEHIDWLETQLELLDKVGLPNYLQSKL